MSWTCARPATRRKAGQWVDVANLSTGAAVRASTNPALGHIACHSTEWSAFLHAVRSDQLGR
ncbi:DUF397 domain-containing protein [Nocardiopsis gilva YIM 90087]|uniref:DUF397 domain-containing protein n=1 Tax=Nocardiopsis gilva YIM 90087 TaxID=1235441 RepID=A0A223SE99_9ACTN|nr:DUF397 domain-containing protein [Nocardiopsis gilva YIM 90087]